MTPTRKETGAGLHGQLLQRRTGAARWLETGGGAPLPDRGERLPEKIRGAVFSQCRTQGARFKALYQVSSMRTHTEAVLARSEATKQSRGSQAALDCFACGSQ